jgi:hypothetical protein
VSLHKTKQEINLFPSLVTRQTLLLSKQALSPFSFFLPSQKKGTSEVFIVFYFYFCKLKYLSRVTLETNFLTKLISI